MQKQRDVVLTSWTLGKQQGAVVSRKDVEFPFGVYYPNVVNNNNEIVSLKNPHLFDVEENYSTLYKMKLNLE